MYETIINWSNDDQAFIADVPELPGCMAHRLMKHWRMPRKRCNSEEQTMQEHGIGRAKSTGRVLSQIAAIVFTCAVLAGCAPVTRIPAASADRGYALPQQALEKLAAAQEQNDDRGYAYPWSGLEAQLAQEPDGRLLLIGYGSLMNLESAAETIEGVNATDFYPVVCVGAKRLFNYRIPDAVLKELAELGGPAQPRELAALNVIPTGRAADLFNGRVVPVAAADLPALRQREYGYHLRSVTCLRWGAWESEPFAAAVLAAEDPVINGRQVIDNTLEPNPAYVAIVDAGTKAVSESFHELFLDTTFLADGKTTLQQWLEARPAPAIP